jgi:tetratricopeptide (TPR) repeat protein
MDSSTWQLFAAGGLILALAIAAYFARRRDQKIETDLINPRPGVDLSGISRADQLQTDAFILAQVNDLNQLPWGENAVPDRQQAEQIYQAALDAIADAEGDYRKLVPIVDDLLKLPMDLALSGMARIVMSLAFYRKGQYSPVGLQAALAYTSSAIQHDPLSVDAWIMRLIVATSVPDGTFYLIAKSALKQAHTLNPNHPRFPDAESKYY